MIRAREPARVFLHNQRIAWEIPRPFTSFYLCGAYLVPPGWSLAWPETLQLWRTHPEGYLVNPRYEEQG